MNTCDGFFWMWFVRPIAEFAGAMVLVGSVLVVMLLILYIAGRQETKQRQKKDPSD